jgi:hypothetical protein
MYHSRPVVHLRDCQNNYPPNGIAEEKLRLDVWFKNNTGVNSTRIA